MRRCVWKAVDWLGVLTVLALLSEGQRSLAGSRNPSDTSGMPPPVAVYDRDPNHLWNRLFGVFYQKKIANNSHDRNMVAWHRNQVGEPHWIGPDVLDPPLGYHPKFLLEDEPFARCNALLDEFISRRGATLIGDPLKRALLQRDLWAVFDVLAEAGAKPEFPFPTSTEFVTRSPQPITREEHRATLEHKLAQLIRSLALSRAQIEKLPDTYSDALRSGAFSSVLQSNRYDFLPDDLFAASSKWHEISPARSFSEEGHVFEILEHTRVAGGRSLFRAFVKLPGNSPDTDILSRYADENVRVAEEDNRYFAEWQQFWSTNRLAHSNVVALASHAAAWKQFALTNRETADHLHPKTFFSVETDRKKSEWERFWATNSISRSIFLALLTNSAARDKFEKTNDPMAVAYAYRHLDPERAHRSIFLPSGMQFLLLREMIALDDNGEMVPTHVVESVQFRAPSFARDGSGGSGVERSTGREVELNRVLLFEGKQGGLRAIRRDELRESFYNSLGHLRVDENGIGPSRQPFPQNCALCHSSNALISPVARFSSPNRSVSIEPIVRWKREQGSLNLLRELMRAPVSDAK